MYWNLTWENNVSWLFARGFILNMNAVSESVLIKVLNYFLEMPLSKFKDLFVVKMRFLFYRLDMEGPLSFNFTWFLLAVQNSKNISISHFFSGQLNANNIQVIFLQLIEVGWLLLYNWWKFLQSFQNRNSYEEKFGMDKCAWNN